jgi:hypothetical protein
MSDNDVHAGLTRALQLSRELLAVATHGDFQSLAELDAERLQLLQSFRSERQQLNAADRILLQEISQLNDRAIGHVEHHRRIKGRDMDLAAAGRRAVVAYDATRLQR